MSSELIILSIATFLSTLLGGLFAMKCKEKIHYIMAFAAGVMLAVVFFDIFPEIFDMAVRNNFNIQTALSAVVAAFLLFHLLEKTILIHYAHESDYAIHKHPEVGVFSALALIGHSFMDGVGIGLAFQVNGLVGLMVALAVISHDFTDGMNTVTLMLNHHNKVDKAKIFLILDAVAPILGILLTFFLVLPAYGLFIYLGCFAGFLLYIGASDILPEAHSGKSSYLLIGLTTLGALLVYIISRFI